MDDLWLPDLSAGGGVKYLAIADALCNAVKQGELAVGDRLPPQRDLAARLGVDLTTVTRAYETARLRGLIEARGRAGSFIRDASKPGSPERLARDAGMNLPPDLPRGALARAIARTTNDLLTRNVGSILQYQPSGGAREDRAVGAALLGSWGIPSSDEDVFVAPGGQSALLAILSSAFVAGDRVACGSHVYPGFKALTDRMGLNLVPLPQMTAVELQRAGDAGEIKGLYVVPTNDNPTAHTLDAIERQKIAEMALERGIQVIEDDAYGALAASPIRPITSYIPERSWYIASTSKLISPALRVAYVRAPDIRSGIGFAAQLHAASVMAPPINVAMVGAWIADGTFDRLLAKMRTESARRRSIVAGELAGLDFASHPQGYHLWLKLPDHVAARDVSDAMLSTGMVAIPSERFRVGRSAVEAVRVSLGGGISDDRLISALRMLRAYASPGVRAPALV